MEYISYILITLGIIVVCLLLMRPPALPEQNLYHSTKYFRTGTESNHQDELSSSGLILKRELLNVPTPWGWPGHRGSVSSHRYTSLNAQEDHGVSESLYHFVDRLFSEKHTVDSQEYLMKKQACLRAMVEDRFGRACTMKEIKYRSVQPPRLRDPSAPHDQMDNFPSGKLNQIAARIPKQSEMTRKVKPQTPVKKTVGLADMRTPWGW
jgi:hypothetical protein